MIKINMITKMIKKTKILILPEFSQKIYRAFFASPASS